MDRDICMSVSVCTQVYEWRWRC